MRANAFNKTWIACDSGCSNKGACSCSEIHAVVYELNAKFNFGFEYYRK